MALPSCIRLPLQELRISHRLGPILTSAAGRSQAFPWQGQGFSSNQCLHTSVPIRAKQVEEGSSKVFPTENQTGLNRELSNEDESSEAALSTSEIDNSEEELRPGSQLRLPRSVQAVYLRPLRRKAEYGYPTCDLQLRSYTIHNLDLMADFALRAAYYLKLPARGPVPLPKITERWTVPRSNFIHKKSQENFERITCRRLIQILDGHHETISLWLAFLTKHQFHGVGMKANVWANEELGVGTKMSNIKKDLGTVLEPKWMELAQKKDPTVMEKKFGDMVAQDMRRTSDGPMEREKDFGYQKLQT